MPHLQNRPAEVHLPAGWDWDRVEAQRAKWGVADDMIPAATVPGACVAWVTIDSVRSDTAWLEWLMRVEAATGRDVNGYQLGHAYIAHRSGVTASDYALEVVARAGESA
jgi:hypothetical protein